MKNTIIYIIGIILIVAFGMLFDYVENGTNYAKLFSKEKARVPSAVVQPQSPEPASK